MKKALIVDDEPVVLRVMRRSLENQGYEVSSANDGIEALELLRQEQPDVMLTDFSMPRMNGEELCKVIEEEFPKRKFIIILLTSRTETESKSWIEDLPNTYFLPKPVSLRKLNSLLDQYLENDQ